MALLVKLDLVVTTAFQVPRATLVSLDNLVSLVSTAKKVNLECLAYEVTKAMLAFLADLEIMDAMVSLDLKETWAPQDILVMLDTSIFMFKLDQD